MIPATPKGTLYVIATPIGNLEDITLRALRLLKQVDLIVAEDARHSKRLLDHFSIHTPFASSYYQGVERERVPGVLRLLEAGKTLALISDAGTPLVSDPGYPLIRAAIDAGVTVVPVPGATALITALLKSGFPTDRFIFDGTPPKKASARKDYFGSLRGERRTVVLYESCHRVVQTLETLLAVLPQRPLALCRELTKLHEEALWGTAVELLAVLQGRKAIKGEFVLLVGGAQDDERRNSWATLSLAEHVAQLLDQGFERKAALKAVAVCRGLSKREVFDALERAKESG